MREERIENNEVSGLTMLLSLVIIRAEQSERERDQINKRGCDEQMRPGEERRGYGELRLRGNQVSLMNARVSRGDRDAEFFVSSATNTIWDL